MAIALGQQASSGAKFGATSVGVTFGTAPSANDIIVLNYTTSTGSAAATRTWPTGFTEFINYDNTNDLVAAAWKRAGASEPTTYTLTLGAGTDSNQIINAQTWTGCITSGSPIDVNGVNHFGGFVTLTTVTWAAITTVTNGAMHVLLVHQTADTTLPAVTGYTQLAYDSAHWLGMWYKAIATAGSTGSPSATFSGTQNVYEQDTSYALSPAGAGGFTAKFRRTLGLFGNHVGGRQMQRSA